MNKHNVDIIHTESNELECTPKFIFVMVCHIPPGVVSGGSVVGSVLEGPPKKNKFF